MEPTFATRWFYRQKATLQKPVQPTLIQSKEAICAVCGLPTNGVESPSRVLRKTFSDYDVLRCPDSDVVCQACVWYFDNQGIRWQSWWLTENEARAVDKSEMYHLLNDHLKTPPGEDGYYLFSTMKRKHLALHAPLNMAGEKTRRIRFETSTIDLTLSFWRQLTTAAYTLRKIHSWTEIQSDNYYASNLAKWSDISEFMQLRKTIKPHLNTPFFVPAYKGLIQYIWTEELQNELFA